MPGFAEQFAHARDTLPGNASMNQMRARSLERLLASGLPTRKHEHWRYTDLGFIAERGFDLTVAPQSSGAAASSISSLLLLEDAPRAIFMNGVMDPSSSTFTNEDSITIDPLALHWDTVATTTAAMDSHPLGLLNTAFTRDGAYVRVAPKALVTRPVSLVFVGSERAGACQPRLVIDVGERAQAQIVVQFRDTAAREAWTNVVTEVRLGARAHLDITFVQEHDADQFHTSLITARLGQDAELRAGQFDIGGRMARNDIEILLAERGARAHLYGVALALDGRHIDTRICVDHAAEDTHSEQNFRGIAGSRSRSVFGGKVIVRPGSQRINAHQRSDNLLLDQSGEIDTKPELEIYADDVKCSHGATVGELDEQHLFYLQARGIDATTAKALLTFAFANAVLDDVQSKPLRAALASRIAEHLPHPDAWEQPE
jgi:Fe-S cluster assembly protein SufD